jgi:PEGA domain
MTQWRHMRTLVAGAAILAAAFTLPGATQAQSRGGHGSHGGGYHGGGYHGGYGYGRPVFVAPYYPYAYPYFAFGFGFGPYWGPYGGPWAYGPPGGIDMSAAFASGYGAIDLSVKPGDAEVWADGKFVAAAKDLDGYPSYLWLPEGAHHLIVYKGGYARFEEDVEVQRGYRKELKVRLEKGESQPPGLKPGKAPEPPKKEEPPKTDSTL